MTHPLSNLKLSLVSSSGYIHAQLSLSIYLHSKRFTHAGLLTPYTHTHKHTHTHAQKYSRYSLKTHSSEELLEWGLESVGGSVRKRESVFVKERQDERERETVFTSSWTRSSEEERKKRRRQINRRRQSMCHAQGVNMDANMQKPSCCNA